MNRILTSLQRYSLLCGLIVVLSFLGGCQSFLAKLSATPTSEVSPLPVPVASHEFSIDTAREDVIGTLQIVTANKEDTLSDIARRFNLGYEEIVSANPDVDPWLLEEGTEIVVPTQFVLPNAPRTGIVVNLPAMRLFYFPKARTGEPQKVITHPLGIGRVNWRTPEGTTRIVSKTENPAWIPTPSIHKEYAKNGNPLPAVVPPGPDNPLGAHILKFAWTNYAIHGTDKPPSIGLRGSSGCLRMYPEDIARIYNDVPIGTVVRVVNQPHLFGWRGQELYLQAYPILEDDKRNHGKLLERSLHTAHSAPKVKLDGRSQASINPNLLDEVILNSRAIAIPVTQPQMTLQTYLDHATRVQNALPSNATWNGNMSGQLMTSEVLEMAENEP